MTNDKHDSCNLHCVDGLNVQVRTCSCMHPRTCCSKLKVSNDWSSRFMGLIQEFEHKTQNITSQSMELTRLFQMFNHKINLQKD